VRFGGGNGAIFRIQQFRKIPALLLRPREILLGELHSHCGKLHPHCDVVTAWTSHAQFFNDCLILCGGDVAR
jgi:hypothetical protein